MALLSSIFESPIGNINLIADDLILIAANLSTMKAAKESLHIDYANHKIESVKKIPVITELLKDYFDCRNLAIKIIF